MMEATPFDDRSSFEPDDDDFQLVAGLDEAIDTQVIEADDALAPEPLFSVLLKRVIRQHDQQSGQPDRVLRDYVELVAPQLSILLADKTAKGGNFVIDKRAEGVSEEELKRYGDDQSMRAHLINGLFPVARIAKLLQAWEVPTFRQFFDEAAYRLFCAGYTLHDWLKLPDVDAELAAHGLDHAKVNSALHLEVVEGIISAWCVKLGLDTFLEPLGPLATQLHDLIFIASNTQVKWGTMRNLAELPGLNWQRRDQVSLATQLSNLADLLAYLGRTPIDTARHRAIGTLLSVLSDGAARLTYHHVAEVRGILTNLINNAALSTYQHEFRQPILFAPTGVVYLERKGYVPDTPDVRAVAEATIAKIQATCREQLKVNLTGFQRDGKGLKSAPYYDLFFSPRQFTQIVAQGAYKRTLGKTSAAETRYSKMQATGMLPTGACDDFPREITVDMIAEGCALLEKLLKQHAPMLDAQSWLLDKLGVSDIGPEVTEIPQRATTGGVPYQWYYAAGVVHQRRRGLHDQEWQQELHAIAAAAAQELPDLVLGAGWDQLRSYVTANLRFEQTRVEPSGLMTAALRELEQYSGARKPRNSTVLCSLCTSPYSVSEQREAAILFAPMVYTNKQPLHGGRAIRNICAICEIEMMLRQLLMNRSSASGGKFEGQRQRYLFFYPTYFFTPETLEMLRLLTLQLKGMRFTALRKLLVQERNGVAQANLDPETFQKIEDLLLDPDLLTDPSGDRWLRYSGQEAATFTLIGIPPSERDAKDAEAWIQPAFLALVLPLVLDVKVVASESMLPLFNEATELPETVALDAPHPFVTYLTRSNRINLDQLGPVLKRLTTAYLIHLDGNAKSGSKGYDYRWHDMPALARNLDTSPSYAFAYLKKWQRRLELDSFGVQKAALYIQYVNYLDAVPRGGTRTHEPGKEDATMSYARQLTELYRQFYRAERISKSNAILRPISIAADAILTADPRLFPVQDDDPTPLIEAVQGKLRSFIENVSLGRADGRLPKGSNRESRDTAILEFSTFFVVTIFQNALGGNHAALRGKQLNLLKNACEVVYLDQWRRERPEQRVEDEGTANTAQPTPDL
jgi:CRISPR-associated protein Csc3